MNIFLLTALLLIKLIYAGVMGAQSDDDIYFYFSIIAFLGLILGIIASAFAFKKLWWVEIILIGALFNTIIQWIGLWQKRKLLESF